MPPTAMFSFFRNQPKVSRARQAVAAECPPAASGSRDHDDRAVTTIDEWFVRTAARLLKRTGRGGEPDGKRKSPQEQRVGALEQENAALKADNEHLSSEVVALRTLLYGRDRRD